MANHTFVGDKDGVIMDGSVRLSHEQYLEYLEKGTLPEEKPKKKKKKAE